MWYHHDNLGMILCASVRETKNATNLKDVRTMTFSLTGQLKGFYGDPTESA